MKRLIQIAMNAAQNNLLPATEPPPPGPDVMTRKNAVSSDRLYNTILLDISLFDSTHVCMVCFLIHIYLHFYFVHIEKWNLNSLDYDEVLVCIIVIYRLF